MLASARLPVRWLHPTQLSARVVKHQMRRAACVHQQTQDTQPTLVPKCTPCKAEAIAHNALLASVTQSKCVCCE